MGKKVSLKDEKILDSGSTLIWLQGFFGNERDYLMVTNSGLRDYRMYIGARDYGNNLDVQKQGL
jgi:hypothetical protein